MLWWSEYDSREVSKSMLLVRDVIEGKPPESTVGPLPMASIVPSSKRSACPKIIIYKAGATTVEDAVGGG